MKIKSVRFILIAMALIVVFALPSAALAMRYGARVTQAGMFSFLLTPENLSIILAGLLAYAFDWFPGLAPWFDKLSILKKKQLVIVILLGVVGVIFAGSCYGLFETGYACTKESIPELVKIILVAASANQAVHFLTKPEPNKG